MKGALFVTEVVSISLTSSSQSGTHTATLRLGTYAVELQATAAGSTGPSVPDLQTPTAGATGVSLRPTFTWSGSGASYHLQLSTASDFTTLAYEAQGLTERSHVYPDTLLAETTYHWRVEACDAQDTCSAWSQARSFTTGTGGSAVTAPVLAAPEDGSYIGPTTAVTLEWNAVGGATRYEVQVAEDGDFAGASTDEATTTAYTATGLTVQAAYGWRVKACADLTCGAWSVAWTFRTQALELTRYYYLRDHLGSVRVTVNEQGAVVHRDDYYPFGLPMPQRDHAAGAEGHPAGKPRYTGHEQEVELDPDAKGVYYAGARYYDAVIGRWNAVDPLAEDPAQIDKSPYAYAWNNPTNLTDPDGRCPWCWGVAIGAGVEFGSQVVVSMNNGQSFGEAVRNVDYADVGIAAASGAASGGLSTLRTVGTVGRTAAAVTLSVGEGAAKAKAGSQTSDYGVSEGVADVIVAGAGQRVADAAKAYVQGTRQGRLLNRTADRLERVHRNNPRPSRAARARQARAQADSYGGGPVARSIQTGAQSTVTGAVGPFVSGNGQGQGGRVVIVITGGRGGAAADNTRVIIRLSEQDEEQR